MSFSNEKERIQNDVLEMLDDFYEIGCVSKTTMNTYKESCLPKPKSYTSKDVSKIRKKWRASQAVFADWLNVSTSTVQSWEIGDKKPSGLAQRLLQIIESQGAKGLARLL